MWADAARIVNPVQIVTESDEELYVAALKRSVCGVSKLALRQLGQCFAS